jgi:hypothetical protein
MQQPDISGRRKCEGAESHGWRVIGQDGDVLASAVVVDSARQGEGLGGEDRESERKARASAVQMDR